MKTIYLSAVLLISLQTAFAQTNQNPPAQPGTQQTSPTQTGTQQTSPTQTGTQQTSPSQNTPIPNPNSMNTMQPGVQDWNLYGGTNVDRIKVPQTTVSTFNSKYPDQKDVTWYGYSNGYIAAYPDDKQVYQGVIYDKNGKMTGTAKRIKYSTLPNTFSANMHKKYPDYKSEYIYEVTTPDGKKSYATDINGEWTNFNESGVYIPEKK